VKKRGKTKPGSDLKEAYLTREGRPKKPQPSERLCSGHCGGESFGREARISAIRGKKKRKQSPGLLFLRKKEEKTSFVCRHLGVQTQGLRLSRSTEEREGAQTRVLTQHL